MECVLVVTEAIERCDNDEEFLMEMVSLFRDDLVECKPLLAVAYQDRNLGTLQEISHRIKGQASMLAAKDLYKKAQVVEHASKTCTLVEHEFNQLKTSIDEFLLKTSDIEKVL